MIFIDLGASLSTGRSDFHKENNENHRYFDEISVKSSKHPLDDFRKLLDRFLWYKSSSQTLSDTLGPKKWGPATYQTRAMLPPLKIFQMDTVISARHHAYCS